MQSTPSTHRAAPGPTPFQHPWCVCRRASHLCRAPSAWVPCRFPLALRLCSGSPSSQSFSFCRQSTQVRVPCMLCIGAACCASMLHAVRAVWLPAITGWPPKAWYRTLHLPPPILRCPTPSGTCRAPPSPRPCTASCKLACLARALRLVATCPTLAMQSPHSTLTMPLWLWALCWSSPPAGGLPQARWVHELGSPGPGPRCAAAAAAANRVVPRHQLSTSCWLLAAARAEDCPLGMRQAWH